MRPLKLLIIPDKFKGTLTARAASQAIARGWRKARPWDNVSLLPMSDGGEGFGAVMSGLLGARVRRVKTMDAAHRPCFVPWWWKPQTRTAIIETSQAIGLAMLPAKMFHPSELDTFGLGAIFRAAAEAGAQGCLLGIGGSATNDGGFGLARAMGWEFLDKTGRLLEHWTELHRLRHIRRPRAKNRFKEIVVAVDVQNPLLGPRGATRVYGPQKGLQPGDFPAAESCLRSLARIWEKDFGSDFSRESGAGAAGGLGFGLRAFLGARLERGFELFADYARLDQRLRLAGLVITGEGAIDESSLMGKGVGEIARRCRRLKIPCIGLGGTVSNAKAVRDAFSRTLALTEITSENEAKAETAYWLGRIAAQSSSEVSSKRSWLTRKKNQPDHVTKL